MLLYAENKLSEPGLPGRRAVAEPLRRGRRQAPPAPPVWRRMLTYVFVFATVVLLVDALAGQKGLVETMRARQQSRELADALQQLRHENARLREYARLLKEDPAVIEAIARRELGLIRPGEVLFILKDPKAVR